MRKLYTLLITRALPRLSVNGLTRDETRLTNGVKTH